MGDLVLLRNMKQELRKGGKQESNMLGPFKIAKLQGKIAELVTFKGKKTVCSNIDLLAPYVLPEERIPAKLRKLDPSTVAGPSQHAHIHSTQTCTSQHAHIHSTKTTEGTSISIPEAPENAEMCE